MPGDDHAYDTGGVAPRQIKCFGWCIAGMTATVAAAWIALRYPTADIRCITFGGQKLGNRAFARTFRYSLLLVWDPCRVACCESHEKPIKEELI